MKINKNLLSTLLCVFAVLPLSAQTGLIQGSVKSSDNQPVEFVNISLKGTTKGSVSDKQGWFEIRNVQPGSYSIIASRVGSNKQEQVIQVKAGETATIQFALSENSTELAEIVIIDNRPNRFYSDSAFIISKLPLKDIENPQVYNSVSRKLLADQVVTNLNDALKNATGITRLWESTGRGGDGAEFYSIRGFAVQPSMVNGMPSVNNGGLDPVNIETVDVIKGPSGTLFGSPMISYGGLINITTKRPYEIFGGEFGYVSGSNGLNRVTGDVNVPLSSNAFVRLNTAYNTQNSFQDAGFSKSFFVAPSLTFKASDKLTFLINSEFMSRESANAPMVFLNRYAPLTHTAIDNFEAHYKKSFTSNDLSMKNPTMGMQIQALYKLSETWTSQTILSRSNTKTNGYYHYLWDFSDGNTFGRYISRRNGETNTTDIQQNFIGDFKLGNLRNRMVIGVDYFKSNILNGSTGWVLNGAVTITNGEDSGILTQAGVNNLLINSSEGNSDAGSEVLSAYVSDVINISPFLSAMASVRLDRFEGKTAYWATEEVKSQTSVSPKFGLVYQPIKDKISVFANYLNGFINVAPAQVSDIDGNNPRMKSFNPEQANQYEFGVKSNFFRNKISATASYYTIQVKNRVMTDPNNINNSIQGGEVESKGFEVSVVANPINGLNLVAGFSKNDSEITRDNPGDGYVGLRPEEAGPATLVNFWAGYTAQTGVVKGLGLGFGGNYAGEHKTLNRANTGTFTLPAYTILNAALSYNGGQYSIILKANNLLNEKYYSGWSTVTPQNLRNISLGLSYRFNH
jgi:iron complex outermembrane receptor protein